MAARMFAEGAMARKSYKLIFSIATLALMFTGFTTGQAAQGQKSNAFQKRRVAARGHLTSSRDTYQIITWQTENPSPESGVYAQAHLAIETTEPKPRTLWKTDGGESYYEVNSIQVSDLDGDGVPEIASLWWVGASAGATLRVFHWNKESQTFVELQPEGGNEIGGIHRYSIVSASGRAAKTGRSRLVVYTRSGRGAGWPPVAVGQYEVRGGDLTRVGGRMNEPKQTESGIEGIATITPIRPGPIRLGDKMPSQAPYQTTMLVLTKDDREVTRFTTGSDGRFRVSLAPGQYSIRPLEESRRFPRGGHAEVTVRAGQFTHVDLTFDSGMR